MRKNQNEKLVEKGCRPPLQAHGLQISYPGKRGAGALKTKKATVILSVAESTPKRRSVFYL